MTEKNRIKFRQALNTDKDFLAFLENEIHSDKYQKQKEKTEQGEHPPEDMLDDYVMGFMDEEDENFISEHITFCGICNHKVLELIRFEEGLQKEERQIKPFPFPLVKGIRDIFSKFLSSMLPAKIVTVIATLFLIIFIGLYQTPIYIDFKIIAENKIINPRSKPIEDMLPASGDFYKIRFEINKPAHIYAIFYDSRGEIDKAYLGKRTSGTHEVSQNDKGLRLQLDYNTGMESVYLLASEKRIEGFDEKAQNLKKIGIRDIKKIFPNTSIKLFRYQHE